MSTGPRLTYVGRADAGLERSFRQEIDEGYKIVAVTGPTKSGKTVLARHVLGEERSITVNGGQVKESSDLWADLLSKLSLPVSVETSSKVKGAIGLGWLIAAQSEASRGVKAVFSQPHKTYILDYIRDHNLTLVIDDFHYMSAAVQKDIVRVLKSEVFDGLVAVLIAVPHRAFDAIGVEREMEGRFAHIEIPVWSEDELQKIAGLGFPLLNMNVQSDKVEKLSREAYGSPLLMQRFCARLCAHYDVRETNRSPGHYHPSDEELREIFIAVAKQFGLPTFQKLSRGPQSRSRRIERKLRSGQGAVDRYEAVLKAVAMTGPKETVHYDEIRDKLKVLLDDGSGLQKHEVSAALGHMASIAKNKIDGEPALEWLDDVLYITDPFLMFYMRWTQRMS